ncbi:hypothetical protein [Microbacterium sp. NPDC090003]|uniref:hypothetical protein n=1 Tax=Microbacterium sp. NPDC090003 TaxID=3364203 RepID=UPI0037F35D2E
MSGAERSADDASVVGMPAGADAEENIAELLEQRQGEDAGLNDVPAGGAGADSGGTGAVGVDDATDEAASAEAKSYDSQHNDEPGVGNRRS